MGIEEKLLKKFESDLASGENICYFAMDLIKEDYDPKKLAYLARQRHLDQRAGYLAELCAQTARLMHLRAENKKLTEFYQAAFRGYNNWEFLDPTLSERLKKVEIKSNQNSRNKKWKIYSSTDSDEIEDFADLYVTQDFLKYTPSQRSEMQEKGQRYTRFARN